MIEYAFGFACGAVFATVYDIRPIVMILSKQMKEIFPERKPASSGWFKRD